MRRAGIDLRRWLEVWSTENADKEEAHLKRGLVSWVEASCLSPLGY